MASSAADVKGSSERGGNGRRAELLLILLFWTFAFALSSARGVVANEIPFNLIAPHRAAVMLFGAPLCWLMIHVLEAARLRSFAEKALWGLAGAAAMSALQSLFHLMSCRVSPIPGYAPMSVPEALSAALVSFAYFTAWTWMHLALLYHRQLEAGRKRQPADDIAPAPASEAEERSFWASRHRQVVRVREEEIAWVEAQGDYVLLHAPGGGGMLRETLASVQAKLDAAQFVRVHRSAIVRRIGICAIRRRPSGALTLTLASGEEVPVGRSYVSGLRALIEEMRRPGRG